MTPPSKQRGLVVELILLAVVAASFAGLWAYYRTQMAELTAANKAKAATIVTMGQEKATCEEAKTGLSAANGNFVTQVGVQNAAILELQRARDLKAGEAKAAKADAAKQSVVFKGRVAGILAQVAGVDWCSTWGKMATDYTVMRQAGGQK